MKKNFFLDTSAYLALLLQEESCWSFLQKEIQNGSHYCSTLLFAEVQRNLVRLTRAKKILPEKFDTLLQKLKNDVHLFCYKEPTLDLTLSSTFPAVLLPKTMDLLHLRTALWFKEKVPDLIFITLDNHQRQSASELNLDILEIN